jgi:hypothetical protein
LIKSRAHFAFFLFALSTIGHAPRARARLIECEPVRRPSQSHAVAVGKSLSNVFKEPNQWGFRTIIASLRSAGLHAVLHSQNLPEPRLASLIIPTQFHSGGYSRRHIHGDDGAQAGVVSRGTHTTKLVIVAAVVKEDVHGRAHLGASSAPAGTSRTATPRGTSLRSTCRAPLVHGGAVRVAGAHVPRDDAPDPRDRRGEAARAGRVAAEQASSVTMAEAEASSKPRRCRRSRASCRRSGSSRPSSGARSARRSPSCCPRSSTSASWHPCKRSRWTVVRGRFELMIDQFSCCRLVLLYKFKLHDISPHSFCFRAQKYV